MLANETTTATTPTMKTAANALPSSQNDLQPRRSALLATSCSPAIPVLESARSSPTAL
jgi:hypothetical protein